MKELEAILLIEGAIVLSWFLAMAVIVVTNEGITTRTCTASVPCAAISLPRLIAGESK